MDSAFLLMLLGVLGICAGFCGRVLIGVVGGVVAVVSFASLVKAPGHIHGLVAVAAIPISAAVIFLLIIARRGRRSKAIAI